MADPQTIASYPQDCGSPSSCRWPECSCGTVSQTTASIRLWLLRSVDGGRIFEDDSATKQRGPDIEIRYDPSSGVILGLAETQFAVPPGPFRILTEVANG